MVFGGAERLRPRAGDSVLSPVDEFLRVFDAAADLEGFEFSRRSLFPEPPGEGAAAESGGDQREGRFDRFARRCLLYTSDAADE